MKWNEVALSTIAQSRNRHGEATIDKVAIFALQDGSPWTNASDSPPQIIHLNRGEAYAIADALRKKDFQKFEKLGVRVEKVKYLATETDAEAQRVVAICKGYGGVVLQAANRGIVLAHFREERSDQRFHLTSLTKKAVQFLINNLKNDNL